MNTLHCPFNEQGKSIKQQLDNAGIEVVVVYKSLDSTPRLFVGGNSYKGATQISGYIQSVKR